MDLAKLHTELKNLKTESVDLVVELRKNKFKQNLLNSVYNQYYNHLNDEQRIGHLFFASKEFTDPQKDKVSLEEVSKQIGDVLRKIGITEEEMRFETLEEFLKTLPEEEAQKTSESLKKNSPHADIHLILTHKLPDPV